MNGYLNNLTLRTLNAGNRVEPRLPALFEPSAFESGQPLAVGSVEEEVTTVSEPAEPRVKTEARSLDEASPRNSSVAKREIEPGPAVRRSSSATSKEDVETQVEPVSHEAEQEDPIADLTVQATLQPRLETVESPTPLTIEDSLLENDPPLEIDESSNPSLQGGGLTPLWPRSNFVDNKAASGGRTLRKGQTPPAALTPTPRPQITFRRTNSHNTAESPDVSLEEMEEISELEPQTINNPEPEPEFESTNPSPYRRVNPTPATWRDTRQQQWRRRQSPAPVESEPSINVTIGRIEVRAVPADNRKTTAPRRSESPVMPLEDYLRKQRRGGEK